MEIRLFFSQYMKLVITKSESHCPEERCEPNKFKIQYNTHLLHSGITKLDINETGQVTSQSPFKRPDTEEGLV